eukprot:scaffold9490_cov128-Isochrysis_galbana.AAC.2
MRAARGMGARVAVAVAVVAVAGARGHLGEEISRLVERDWRPRRRWLLHDRRKAIAKHAFYIPISHSLTRLRLLFTHLPLPPLPTKPVGKVSWGGMR